MFNNFKKLAFVAGTAFAFANVDAATITISGEIQVDAGGTLEVTRLVPLSDGAKIENYGNVIGHTEAGDPGEKIQHPTGGGEEAAINNYGGVVAGDADKIDPLIPGVYSGGGFTGIRAVSMPFLDANLIAVTLPSAGGWGDGTEVHILNTVTTEGISLVMGNAIPDDYNNSGAARTGDVFDFQCNPPTGSRVNLLGDLSVTEINTSDLTPAHSASNPCGVDTTTHTYYWPVNMGSKGGTSSPTIRATGGGTVRLEGDNTFYEVGTVEVVAGTTLLATTAASMPQSNITVGVAADTNDCTFTFPDDLTVAATYSVAAGKALSLVHGASGNGQAVVKNLSTLDVSAGTLNVQAGTKVTVEHGGTLVL